MALSDQLPFLQKFNPDDLYNLFLGLDRKRQILAGVAAGVLLVAALFVPMSCVSDQLNAKQQEYEKHVEQASRFYGYLSEYKRLQKAFDSVEKNFAKMGADSVSTVVYNIANEIGIQKSKIALKQASFPNAEGFQEVGKEVSLRAVPFDELMRLIGKIAAYQELPLTIKKLTLKADMNDKTLLQQASFTVSTVKPNR